MAYQRKTRDYWDIEQLCCGSWEVVNAEETWKDARRSLREYRENQPEYPVRARRKRERIQSEHTPMCERWISKLCTCGFEKDSGGSASRTGGVL